MAAERIQFPRRWASGTISTNLDVIWGISTKISELPDSYRTVLLLRDIEEMTTREVAQELKLTEENVKVRLHRARSALKKLLEPELRGLT